MTGLCLHCQTRWANRSRGLCEKCYYTPEIRQRYPSTHKNAPVQHGSLPPPRLTKPEPTTAIPGTPEKVAVMAARAEAHQELWHPQDAVLDEPVRDLDPNWLLKRLLFARTPEPVMLTGTDDREGIT